MQNQKISLARLGETGYWQAADPRYTLDTPFGSLTRHPDFPDVMLGNQLIRCRVEPSRVPALLNLLKKHFADRSYRALSGHDPATYQTLIAALEPLGWQKQAHSMLVLADAPQRPINPAIKIEVVDPLKCAAFTEIALASGALPQTHQFRLAQDRRLGGECILAYLKSQPVGYSGWYIVDGLARYRRIGVLPEFRGQGIGTTIVRYVQDHPTVKAQEALVIFAGHGGRQEKLYRQLGFSEGGISWFLSKNLSKRQ